MAIFNNFSYSTVLTAPSPPASGTFITVQSGHGSRFPSVPFRGVVWPASDIPTVDNAEIFDATGLAGDILTVVRAREGTAARTIMVGDQIAAVLTRDVLQTLRDAQVRINRYTPPVNSEFAWVNQGASAIVDDTDSVVLVGAPTGVGFNAVLRVKTAPAPPYTLTVYLLPLMIHKAFNGYGVCFRESGTGEIHALDVVGADAGLTTFELRSVKFTSPTVFSASYQVVKVGDMIRWFRLADDGINRICSISADGVNWIQVHSIGRTDFLTADQIGFHLTTENSATPNFAPIVRVAHWVQA